MTRAGTPCFARRCPTRSPASTSTRSRALRLAEQQRTRGQFRPVRKIDRRAELCAAIHDAALGERDGEAAVGAVVRRAHDAALDRLEQRVDQRASRPRDRSAAARRRRRRGCARRYSLPPSSSVGVAEQDDRVALALERATRVTCASESIRPTMPITGVGYTAPDGFSLYSETLPPVTGVSERVARLAHSARPLRAAGSRPRAASDCRSSGCS